MHNNKIWVWIDPTDLCNLSCKLCYTRESHGKNFMTTELFRLIIDKLLADRTVEIQHLHLNWRGEPFLNSKLPEFLAYLNELNIQFPVHLHTNGTILSDKILSKLTSINFKIDFTLFFSLDGDSKDLHEKNRGSNTFDKSIKSFNLLLAQSLTFRLGLFEIIIDQSSNKIYELLVRRPDVHHRVHPLYPNLVEMMHFKDHSFPEELIAQNPVNIESTNPTIPERPCLFMGNTFAINPNGEVSICLLSHSKDGLIGNIITDDIKDIIKNGKIFRQDVINNGRSATKHCLSCMKPEDPTYIKQNNYETVKIN